MNNQKRVEDKIDYTPNKVVIAVAVGCLVGVILWPLIPIVQGWLS